MIYTRSVNVKDCSQRSMNFTSLIVELFERHSSFSQLLHIYHGVDLTRDSFTTDNDKNFSYKKGLSNTSCPIS